MRIIYWNICRVYTTCILHSKISSFSQFWIYRTVRRRRQLSFLDISDHHISQPQNYLPDIDWNNSLDLSSCYFQVELVSSSISWRPRLIFIFIICREAYAMFKGAIVDRIWHDIFGCHTFIIHFLLIFSLLFFSVTVP